jgi:hypothetical protein
LFFFSVTYPTDFGDHPACSVDTGGSFTVVNQQRCAVNCCCPATASVNNEWSCTSAPPILFHAMDRETLLFSLLFFYTKLKEFSLYHYRFMM